MQRIGSVSKRLVANSATLACYIYLIKYLMSHFLTNLHLEVWCYTYNYFSFYKHFTYFYYKLNTITD